jgi:hypothetical protein
MGRYIYNYVMPDKKLDYNAKTGGYFKMLTDDL